MMMIYIAYMLSKKVTTELLFKTPICCCFLALIMKLINKKLREHQVNDTYIMHLMWTAVGNVVQRSPQGF